MLNMHYPGISIIKMMRVIDTRIEYCDDDLFCEWE